MDILEQKVLLECLIKNMDVAQVLGISRANAYVLMHSKGFPTLKIGKRMTVPKDKLIAWMEKQLAA